MKKIAALVLALVMILSATSSFAAGKLRVEQENFHVVPFYGTYGYCYAKVANVGDKPIKVNTGLLEIFNADGDALTSTDYYDGYAEYLAPGEYTYVSLYDEVEDVEPSAVADYMLTITGKADNDYTIRRFPCTSSYEANVQDGYWTYNYMYATYTNDTDKPVYGISLVMALLDAEGNILYIEDDDLYNERGLMPGSSMTIRKDVSSSFMEYFEKNGLVPASVDAFAFVKVEVE